MATQRAPEAEREIERVVRYIDDVCRASHRSQFSREETTLVCKALQLLKRDLLAGYHFSGGGKTIDVEVTN